MVKNVPAEIAVLLEAIVHEVKTDISNVSTASTLDRPDKISTRTRGSSSPFRCIAGLVQQMNQEKDQEISSARLCIEELEALAANRYKEISRSDRLNAQIALKQLQERDQMLIAHNNMLKNPSEYQELRADKHHNLQMLNDRYRVEFCYDHLQFQMHLDIGPEQIDAFYHYAKFQFECGNYSAASDYLYQYRALCTNGDRSLSALWGKLAAEILMQKLGHWVGGA
ncbi:hypothetical protein OROHE_009585 [Orobanche hederae]